MYEKEENMSKMVQQQQGEETEQTTASEEQTPERIDKQPVIPWPNQDISLAMQVYAQYF